MDECIMLVAALFCMIWHDMMWNAICTWLHDDFWLLLLLMNAKQERHRLRVESTNWRMIVNVKPLAGD